MIKQRFVKQASDNKEKNVYLGKRRYTNNILSIILKPFQQYSFAGL